MTQSENLPNRRSSFVHRLSNRPAAAVALSFVLGIASSAPLLRYWFSCMAGAAFLLTLASFLALRRNRLILSLALGSSAIALGGLLMGLAARDRFPDSDLRNHISRRSLVLNEPVASEGCVVRDSEMHGEESTATIELLAFRQKDHWVRCTGKAILRFPGISPDDPQGGGFKLIRGDRIRGWATWNLPRNFENPGSTDRVGLLARRDIFLIGRTKSLRLMETIPGGCADPWSGAANLARARVQRSLEMIRSGRKGQPAAILGSLIIGDYSRLENSTREVFQNSGTFHVLVISGLHVAWITGLFLRLLKLVRLPDRFCYLLAFGLIAVYADIVGFQASITRCLWMFLLYLIGRMVFRRADSVNILFGSALILLVLKPSWLFETGFQLSFISVLALALTAVPAIHAYLKPVFQPLIFAGNSDRLFLQPGRYHRLGRVLRFRCELLIEAMADRFTPSVSRVLLPFSRSLAGVAFAIGCLIWTSLCVQIWLQPLLAYYFNRISWVSPLANIVIVPLSSITLAFGIAGAIGGVFPCVGLALTRIGGLLAALLLFCADRLTDLPGAWQRCPTPSPAWVLAGILTLLVWRLLEWKRFWIPCAFIAGLLACLSCASVPGLGMLMEKCRHAFQTEGAGAWDREASILSFTFLDVGEGDSMVVRFPDKRVWILDAGGLRQSSSREDGENGLDIGEAVVSRYLWYFWISRVDRLILSHPDMDHAGGMIAVMNNFRIGRFDYARIGQDRILEDILSSARENQIDALPLYVGRSERIGPVAVRILNPPAHELFATTNENSLVLEVAFKRFSALLTGDLEKAGETEVLSQPGLGRHLLLKVAHHGSRFGTSDAFLIRTRPRWAVISVGRNNPFGHPSSETLTRILHHSARPVSTMEEGAITFETDGMRYILKSHLSGILERGEL
jgi:competence protein ComEC